jgi:hypothetical protein
MALHILRHHQFRAFYWGQNYGGSLESILVAPFVGVFGATTLGLRFASVALTLVMAWLTWRIARHLFGDSVAVWAGILALWWPLALVYFGTQERGFYPLAAALGLTAVLMALYVDADPPRTRAWIGLGIAIGLGWWVSPNVVYFGIPIGMWLGLRGHWRQARNIAIALGAAVIGASVWIIANVRSHFASSRVVPHLAGTSTYWSRFRFFWQTGLPFALGLRRPHTGQWYWSPIIGRATYTAVIVVIVVCLWKTLRTWSIDVLLLAFAPFVFAYFPPTGLLDEGRYTYFIAAMLPLVVCRILQNGWGRTFVVGLVIVTGIAFARDYDGLQHPLAASILPITRTIEHDGYHTAITDYWIAFRMTYQSSERVIASPLPGQAGVRYPPYLSLIAASTPAYVFSVQGSDSRDTALIRRLVAAHISYRIARAGDYYAVLPRAPLRTISRTLRANPSTRAACVRIRSRRLYRSRDDEAQQERYESAQTSRHGRDDRAGRRVRVALEVPDVRGGAAADRLVRGPQRGPS